MAAIEVQQINRVTDALKDDVILISRLGVLHTITMAALQQAVFDVPEVLPNITADITLTKLTGVKFNKEVSVDFSQAITAGLAGIIVTLGTGGAGIHEDGDTITFFRLGNSTLPLTINYLDPQGVTTTVLTSNTAGVMHTLVFNQGIWYVK